MAGDVLWGDSQIVENQRGMLEYIPLDKIVLESDAPHFVPDKPQGNYPSFGVPGYVLSLADELAAWRSTSMKEVLSCSAKNVARLYGIIKR